MISSPTYASSSGDKEYNDEENGCKTKFEDDQNGNVNFEEGNKEEIAIAVDDKEAICKKRKGTMLEMDPSSTTPQKKLHLDEDVRKEIPDLEKYWLAVEKDPLDFSAWTHLLQFVDQLDNVDLAREAYDGFLGRYPYCYGYWKKYADYEKRQSNTDIAVFQRGIKAIPLSVDLWIHYLNYMKSIDCPVEDLDKLFQQAISSCGLEFRSDKLWELYINWTTENKTLRDAMAIMDQVIRTPTQSHAKQFERFVDFVTQTDASQFLSPEEYEQYYLEAKAELSENENFASAVKEKFVRAKEVLYARNVDAVKIRLPYEEAIKRPYFHVKPVEKTQLKVWKDYLNFEIDKGDMSRIITLFERCLIACAMYPEYWQMYLKFLVTNSNEVTRLRDVFNRVCTIHHPKNQFLKLDWATFEEKQGEIEAVRKIFESVDPEEEFLPPLYYRHINFERRQNNFERAKELFETYIRKFKSKADGTHLTIKYARFMTTCLNAYSEAIQLLKNSVENEESTKAKVLMCIVDLGMQQKPMDFDTVLSAFDYGIKHFTKDQKITFAQRKLEFLEEFGLGIEVVQEADDELQGISKTLRQDYLIKNAPKPEPKIPQPVEPDVSDMSAVPPVGYDSYSSIYGEQYNSTNQYDQYTGSWSGTPPVSDPSIYSQTYSNQPNAWNSYYA